MSSATYRRTARYRRSLDSAIPDHRIASQELRTRPLPQIAQVTRRTQRT